MKNKKLFAILTLVCFMMTLMPVAAFAAPAAIGGSTPVADSLSVVWTDDKKVDGQFAEEAAFNLSLTPNITTDVYVWVTAEGSNIPVNTVMVGDVVGTPGSYAASGAYIYQVASVTSGDDQFGVKFMAPGSYQVHVSTTQPAMTNGAIAGASEFKAAGNVVTVVGTNDPSANFVILTDVGGTVEDSTGATTGNLYLRDGDNEDDLDITANNVDEKIVTIKLYKDAAAYVADPTKGKAGVKIDIEPAGAITVDKTTVYTNALGEATFKVGGNKNGTFKVYLSTGRYESSIEVEVGAIVANKIESDCKTGKYDILGDSDFFKVMNFKMYDVNGNKLTTTGVANDADAIAQGWSKAYNSDNNSYNGVDATGYVAIVEKPAASKLENDDLKLANVTSNGVTKTTIELAPGATIDAEGVYTFKVVLDNGSYTTATVDVKEFDKPVQLVIDGANNVELGSTNVYTTIWVDAYGVKEVTNTPELAATGYAVEVFGTIAGTPNSLKVKNDEKYVGAVMTLTAMDQRNDLVATKEVTVASEGQKLSFSKDTVEVNVNNTLAVSVVDANGKLVVLDTAITPTISYVVLEKPEGANVFVNDLGYDGDDKVFYMTLTANKVGNVKVQAVAKYQVAAGMADDGVANVVKYYTGIQEIAVGSGQTGKSVVMSIGSNELIVGSKVETMDAKPMIQNNRTFVPFRALAEAFGATVAYDQATSAVTAELNGVKVVMTVGSPDYTVNGIKKVADVAPFISDSRTFVPVRFAAEAFGIEVVPTYNEDLSVADVLFNM